MLWTHAGQNLIVETPAVLSAVQQAVAEPLAVSQAVAEPALGDGVRSHTPS